MYVKLGLNSSESRSLPRSSLKFRALDILCKETEVQGPRAGRELSQVFSADPQLPGSRGLPC